SLCPYTTHFRSRLGHGAEQRAALVHGLVPLLVRIGVVDDAGAGLHVQAAVLDHRGADRDGGVGVAVPADVADRAGIDVALDRLQFADDLQRADLGRAADGAGGEGGAQHVGVAQPRLQRAGDFADDVHDVAVALDHELFADPDAARLADAADVVAAEVDQHQVLGAFLGVGQQFGFQRAIFLDGPAARAGAGD